MQPQISPRSDSDVLLKELKLKFGETVYTVPVLRAREAIGWRAEYFKRTQQVADSLPMAFDETRPDLAKTLGAGLFQALLKFPDAITELVFSYAPNLPKEKIMAEAYDQEFEIAFKAVWGVAFRPFLTSLGMALETGRAMPSSSASSESTN